MPTFSPDAGQFLVHAPSQSPGTPAGHSESRPALAPLSTLGWVVLFQDLVPMFDFPTASYRRFDGTGTPIDSQPVFVAGGGGTPITPLDVIQLTDGSFMTLWTQGSTPKTIFANRYDATGQQIGSTFSITPPADSGVPGLLTSSIDFEELPPHLGGGFVLTWAHQNDKVYWQQFNASGQATSAVFKYAPAAGWVPMEVRIEAAQTSPGRFWEVHSERQGSAGNAPERILVDNYDASGTLISSYTVPPRTPLSQETFATAGLGDNLVLVWTSSAGVFAQIFKPDGSRSAEIQVSSVTASSVDVVRHPNGFVIAWAAATDSMDSSGSSIKAQAFDFSGNKTGGEILVNDVTAGNQLDPDITVFGNGDIAISWTTPEAGSQTDVAARIFRLDTPGGLVEVDGTGGDDLLVGTNQNERFLALAGNDIVLGGGGSDELSGGDGNDYLDAGPSFSGNDRLIGGMGDDAMIVGVGDEVVEAVGEGYDNVAAGSNYALNAGAEVEVLSTTDHNGTAAINLLGNEFNQVMLGNDGANYLDGGGGTDLLVGRGGDDAIIVGANDRVVEEVGGGFDNVAAKTNYTLNAGAEVEILSTTNHAGTAPIYLIGNEFGQTIIGNAGNNYLVGNGGADRLVGLGGDDTMMVDGDDTVIEAVGGGHDNVAASASFVLNAGAEVETLSTSSHLGTAAINLTGNEFSQAVIGNAGDNVLDGGRGSDRLIGLGGADTFAFRTALGATNVDTIQDLQSGIDKIGLDHAIFSGVTSGNIASVFVVGTAAQDSDDRIIYNQATGQLFYDADGNGAGNAVLFANLEGNPILTASDFIVL